MTSSTIVVAVDVGKTSVGRGQPITDRAVRIGELAAWATHRSRRVAVRSATKNQLLGQLDRAFPGLTRALPDVLGTKIGRLVAAEFSDPARLCALGASRLIRFAALRDVQLRRPVARRLVAAAKDALPTRDLWWPGGCWPPTWGCWSIWTPKSRMPRLNWPRCCR
nr:IS110 family transposase [Mycobacterium gordonae]